MTLHRLISVLRDIRNYYGSRRGVGHTQAMLGNRPRDKFTFVLAVDNNHARVFGDIPAVIPVTIDQLDRLMRTSRPLLIDNYTTFMLCSEAAQRLNQMEDLIARSKAALEAFSGLRCRGGASSEWVDAIDISDTLIAEIDTLSTAG